MSLHQISESERQRGADTRARLERMAITRIIVPSPVAPPIAPVKVFNQSLLDWNCLQYYRACFEPVQVSPAIVKTLRPKSVSMKTILRTVARHYRVSVNEIRSSRRWAVSVRPRQIVMWMAKELTLRSYPEIGMMLGGRDHTTIMHGVKQIETKRHIDPDLQADIDNLLSVLRPVSQEETTDAEDSAGS